LKEELLFFSKRLIDQSAALGFLAVQGVLQADRELLLA